jgi:hypothetical protein
MPRRPALLVSLLCLLTLAVVACCCPFGGRPASVVSPTPTRTRRLVPSPTATVTKRPTVAAVRTPTPTAPSKPTPTGQSLLNQIAASVPDEPNVAFRLTLTDEQLTQLAMEGAERDSEIDLSNVAVMVHPEGMVIAAELRLEETGRELDLEMDVVPTVVDGGVRLEVNRLDLKDFPPLLSDLVTPLVTEVLNDKLDFFNRMQQGWDGVRGLEVTSLELQEGAMIVEGVTR